MKRCLELQKSLFAPEKNLSLGETGLWQEKFLGAILAPETHNRKVIFYSSALEIILSFELSNLIVFN